MTPLRKAKAEEGRVNYCDECEQLEIVGNAAYCRVDGKLIHPIMLMRGQGTGPAWNCKKRKKPTTNADRVRSMTDEELANWLDVWGGRSPNCDRKCVGTTKTCRGCWLSWLKAPVEVQE